MSPETSPNEDVPTAEIALRALGRDLILSVPAETEEAVRGQWSRCLSPTDAAPLEGSADVPVVSADLRPGITANTWQYSLSSEVTFQALASIDRRLNLHAAGVADEEGGVLALVGPSGRGKTTAAAHLGTTFGYVTDECVSVDWEDLSVLPYPKPLSVVLDPEAPGVKAQRGPDELGLVAAPTPLRLRGLVLLDRDPDAAAAGPGEPEPGRAAHLELMDPIEGLLELIPQTSRLLSTERPLATLATLIQRLGGVHRIRYTEAAQLDVPIRELLAAEPLPATTEYDLLDGVRLGPAYDPVTDPAPEPITTEDELAAEAEQVDVETRVVRLDPRDVIGCGAEFVVLYQTLPHHLGVLPTLVWEYAAEPIRVADLHVVAETELGENPESLEFLLLAVRTLIRHGCLRRALSD